MLKKIKAFFFSQIDKDKKLCNSSSTDSPLKHYLNYYCSLKSPGYAVLVTGAWGVGKTFQVKDLISTEKRYFVSLYGIDSVEGIHDAVLSSMVSGVKISEHLKTSAEIAKAIGDQFALGGAITSIGKALLQKHLDHSRTIIFDDLERCSLWNGKKQELMGAINHYVEHGGFKVVVLAHDEKIEEHLLEIKEKTFGHTIQVTPQTDLALSRFIQSIKDQHQRNFVEEHQELIKEIWLQSQEQSLRVLRYVINDIARLRSILQPRHLNKKEGIEQILQFFCLFNIKIRTGKLTADQLINRPNQYFQELLNKEERTGEPTPMSDLASEYPSIKVTDPILSDEILQNTLLGGKYDSNELAAWLDQSVLFVGTKNIEPWRLLMQLDTIDDATLADSTQRLQRQFDNREITVFGEILHMAALRLLMVDIGVLPHSLDNEVSLCKKYIDDLYKQKKISIRKEGLTETNLLKTSYGGYGYWTLDSTEDHFKEIKDHLENVETTIFQDYLQSYSDKALRLLREDQNAFQKKFSQTYFHEGSLAQTPIFHLIDAKKFLEAWLSGPPEGWKIIQRTLDSRYDHDQLDSFLIKEKSWVEKLETEMDNLIATKSGWEGFRLKRLKLEIFETLKKKANLDEE